MQGSPPRPTARRDSRSNTVIQMVRSNRVGPNILGRPATGLQNAYGLAALEDAHHHQGETATRPVHSLLAPRRAEGRGVFR